MFLRWIHTIWTYFWRTVLVLLIIILLLGGGVFGLLQLDTSKNFIANRLEQQFNEQFQGRLSIGNLKGMLPVTFEFTDVTLAAEIPDSLQGTDTESNHLVTLSRLQTRIDLWGLLQNKISITDFRVENPTVRFLIEGDSTYSLNRALQPRRKRSDRREGESWIQEVEIIAPRLSVENGSVYVDRFLGENNSLAPPEPFLVDSIHTTMFLELSEIQRFLDFETFSADLHGMGIEEVQFYGQIYNDSRYLEFNAFNIRTPDSELTLSGQVDGINIEAAPVQSQLPDARYDLEISSSQLVPAEFLTIAPRLPDVSEPLAFSLRAVGDLDSMHVDHLDFGVGESHVNIDGFFRQLTDFSALNYSLNFRKLTLREQDLERITGPLSAKQVRMLQELQLEGNTSGTTDSLSLDLEMTGLEGGLAMQGFVQLRPPFKYSGSLSASALNLAPFLGAGTDTTSLNLDASVNGIGFDPREDLHNVSATLYNSFVDHVYLENVNLQATLIDGFLEHTYRYRTNGEQLAGEGWIDFNSEEPQFALIGEAAGLNLSR
ncbi:MAG: hypothetical protein R3281_14425, partial [Balneolaceae bacterium]|nr:hypothetical protein [Balneolaceae bacterium]